MENSTLRYKPKKIEIEIEVFDMKIIEIESNSLFLYRNITIPD
jgi:hypothetical protein